jgi:hypothetical protein
MRGGIDAFSLSATNYTLSASEIQNLMLKLNGTLLANVNSMDHLHRLLCRRSYGTKIAIGLMRKFMRRCARRELSRFASFRQQMPDDSMTVASSESTIDVIREGPNSELLGGLATSFFSYSLREKN